MSDALTGVSDSTLKDVRPGHYYGGKEEADTGDGRNGNGEERDGDRTATGATVIRHPPKRTSNDADLDDERKGVPRTGKVQRTGQSARSNYGIPRLMTLKDLFDKTDDTEHDQILAQIRSQPKPVFRRPPSLPDFQQRETTRSSSRSRGPGYSQGKSSRVSLTRAQVFPF